jgi:hypothetical protein
MWLDHLPASVAFCDVETTGLGNHDRIVNARFRVDCAARFLALHPTSVTLRSAHTMSMDEGRTVPALSVKRGEQVTPLAAAHA